MKIAVAKEIDPSEPRVAASPDTVKKFKALSIDIAIEPGAGVKSGLPDSEFTAVGATVSADALKDADIIIKVKRPETSELSQYKRGALVIAIMDPYGNEAALKAIADAGVAAFAGAELRNSNPFEDRLTPPASVASDSTARRASEKPIAFSVRMPKALPGSPFFLIFDSMSTMPRISARNQGSILQELKISSFDQPSRIACATCRRRSGVGVPSAARIAFLSSLRPRPSISISSSPVSPVSRPRSAFCRLS